MKKSAMIVIVLLAVLQLILGILRLTSVISWRLLWVLSPVWVLISLAALWGIYLVIRRTNIRS